jgi:thiamine-phosphate pyrophosphorylase
MPRGRATALRRRLSLIVIADPSAAGDRSLLEIVHAAAQAGAPAVQLRAKTLSARETVELGLLMLQECRRTGALFFVNDRVDIALVIGADGAHLGDDDLPLPAARAITPAGFLLGRSVDTPDEARTATRDGADYLGVGPVYATRSKLDLGTPIGPEGVRAVVGATPLPVVGIGGIEIENSVAVRAAGAVGVAVIRSVVAASDPGAAVRQFLARPQTRSDSSSSSWSVPEAAE